MTEPSKAAREMPRSGIREFMDLAWAAPDAIHLEVGEPDFDTPRHIVDAAARAARQGHTKYTPNAGIPPLRDRIAQKVRSVNGYEVDASNVVVTSGAVEGVFAAFLAVVDPGDEILLPDPGWPNHAMMAYLLRATPVRYRLDSSSGFVPSVEELERIAGPTAKVLMLNSPSNPLGSVVSAERMREVLDFAQRRGLWVVSDEVYDQMTYEGPIVSAAAVAGSWREHVVSVYSFSKTYAMTGWRVGYVVSSARLSEILAKIQEPVISCVNAPAQMAALAALEGPQHVVDQMRAAYRERRDVVLNLLDDTPLAAFRPWGAFYLWIDIGAGETASDEFALSLLRCRGVAVAPGTAFGSYGTGAVRISLATSKDLLVEGVERLIEEVISTDRAAGGSLAHKERGVAEA